MNLCFAARDKNLMVFYVDYDILIVDAGVTMCWLDSQPFEQEEKDANVEFLLLVVTMVDIFFKAQKTLLQL